MTARIAPMILAIALSAMVCSSSAGYYAVDYQCSGVAHSQNTGESHDVPYSVGTGVTALVTIGGDQPAIDCHGPIQATFTWVPDNPSDKPPHVAILREEAHVSWQAGESPFCEGDGDDGFGDIAYDDGEGYGMAGRIKYTIVSEPGQAFSAPVISPRVSVSDNEGRLFANVSYSAGLWAIWIDTSYTVNDDEKIFAEAGRPLIPTITCALPGIHFSNYDWSATGRLFKAYNPSQNPTHVEAMGVGDWLSPTPQWFYFDKCASTITCSVDAVTDEWSGRITTHKDILVERVEIRGSDCFSEETDTSAIGHLYTATNPTCLDIAGNEVGMVFAVLGGNSKTAEHFPGGGALTDVQRIDAHWTSGYQELSTDGEFWLDTSFPYSGFGSVQMNNNGLVVATLDDSDAPHFGSGAVAIVTTGFEMNILYMPSCPGSSWVPAAQITWTWNAESGMWKTFGQPDGYPILPSNQIPEWDQVFIP